MLRKILMSSLVAVITCFMWRFDAFAQIIQMEDDSSIETVYQGTMDVINVRGKNYEPREATYIIKDGILYCDFPKIGKMPMGIRIKLKLDVLKEAKVEGNEISFTLNVHGKFMGAHFPTSIHFKGAATSF